MAVKVTRTDKKTIVAIAILSERREQHRTITYAELGKKIGLAHYGLRELLFRVGAWCYKHGKRSLALLVVTNDGKPEVGCFDNPPGHPDPTTPENYEHHKAALFAEDWSGTALPFEAQLIADANVEVWRREPYAA
jgi:hypothetical protein